MTERSKRSPGNASEAVSPTADAVHGSRRSVMTDHYALTGALSQTLTSDEDFSFQDSAIVLIAEINRLYEHLDQHYAKCQDVSPNQIQLLLTLIQCGSLRMTDLSCRLGRSPSNLTPLTRQLEERGLISRSRDTRDGRSILLEATAAGRAVMVDMYHAVSRDAAAEGIGISQKHRRQIIESLEILRNFLAALRAGVSRTDAADSGDETDADA